MHKNRESHNFSILSKLSQIKYDREIFMISRLLA